MDDAGDSRQHLVPVSPAERKPIDRDVTRNRADAGDRSRRVVIKLGVDAGKSRLRGRAVGRPDEADDLDIVALEQPREHLHADESRRSCEEHRLAHRSGAPIA